MHSPFAVLPGEHLPGIGHNRGPSLDGGRRWRAHCWQKARRELLPRLPIEVVRRRVVRARELGLAYPQYASVLLGSGRDIVGFLFTCDAIGIRLERRLELPDKNAEKLRGLSGCDRLLMTPLPVDADALCARLAESHGVHFAAAGASPGYDACHREGREAIRAILRPLKLPAGAVVMIGTRPEERAWAHAADTAKFLSAEAYFANG